MRRCYVARNFALMQPISLNDLLSVTQAADELGIAPRTLHSRITAGKVAATKLGPGTASYVITRAEVERVKAGNAA